MNMGPGTSLASVTLDKQEKEPAGCSGGREFPKSMGSSVHSPREFGQTQNRQIHARAAITCFR